MSDKCIWIIDHLLLDRHDEMGFPNIGEAVEEAGYEVYYTKYKPFCNYLSEMDQNLLIRLDTGLIADKAVVCHGTIGFMKVWNRYKTFNAVPGFYHREKMFDYLTYSSVFGHKMLNDDFVMLPYSEVVRRVRSIFGSKFFIRPNGVTKAFPGRVIDFDSINENPHALSQYEKICDDELCVIASPKPIMAESRHIVVNRKVITESTYRYDSILDIRIDVHPKSSELARWVAEREWQPDNVYVVDIAYLVDKDEAKIIEFNTFSCSGLYACDTRKIATAVSKAAIDEYNGVDLE